MSRDELMLALIKAKIELEYAHTKLGNDRSIPREEAIKKIHTAIEMIHQEEYENFKPETILI